MIQFNDFYPMAFNQSKIFFNVKIQIVYLYEMYLSL